MHVSLELYRAFYVTATTGSISKAAKELFTSQPAVSQSIKVLEYKLGGQLFIRTPKGVKLTVEGNVLFKYIEQGYSFFKTAE
jgi:DNA-binding transcriptional LysR family regulator